MRRLLWFSVGFFAACLAFVYLLPASGALCYALLGVLGGVSACCLRRFAPRSLWTLGARRVLCACLGLSFGLLWCAGCDALRLGPARAAGGRYERLEAELCSFPTETAYGHTADAEILLDGTRVKARLYLYGALPELEPGDRIAGAFTLRRADRSADGETRLDLLARGILLTGTGTVLETADGGAPLRYFPVRLSRRISARLAALLPADAAGLPRAMLTGDRSGLSEADRSAMTLAGASHVLAVSGIHVSMLMAVLWLLAGRGRHSAVLGLFILGLFVLMTGASPSVARAALMLVPLLLAPLFRAENDPPTSLALAGLVLLLRNPWTAADLSFQLSFAAVAGLLLVTPRLDARLTALPPVSRLLRWNGLRRLPLRLRGLLLRLLRRLVRGFCASIAASLGALLFTTPIAAAAFGTVPVYAVLTNLLILFPAAVCLSGSLAVLALGLLSTTLGSWAGWLLAWVVRWILWVCRAVAALPGSQLYPDGYGIACLIFCYGLLLLLLALREKRLAFPLLCLLTALIATVGLQRLEAASASFTLAALDVGQGQCVCALSSSFTAVIDCGGSGGGKAGSSAADWLRQRGAERIDALILTHYDTDHVNGAATLLALVPVETVYLPDVDGDPENRAAVEAAALAAGSRLCYVTENRTLPFSDGQLRLFAPVSDRNDNAACVCVLYSVGEYDMLVSGDLDAGAEYALLEREALPPVELYVAGHHGSGGSSTEALLAALRPDTVFISVGRNSYGLPSPAALDRFAACGAQVYRTDECGNLVIGR